MQEDRVRPGRVHRVPPSQERAHVGARPVSQVQVGATDVVRHDTTGGKPEDVQERLLERLLVAVAPDVDALHVCSRERTPVVDGLHERRASDITELAVVRERGRRVGGTGQRRASDHCEGEERLHAR